MQDRFFKLALLCILNTILLPFYAVTYVISLIFSFIPIFPTKIANKNIRARLNMKGIKVNLFIASLFMNYIFYLIEALVFEFFKLNYACYEGKEFDFCQKQTEVKNAFATDETHEFVYILSHMGNVEMYTKPILKTMNSLNIRYKLYALAKASPFKMINKLLHWYRSGYGMDIIWTTRDMAQKMKYAITEEKASLCMVVDQKPKIGGIFIRFFGEFAAFPTSGLRMCLNHNMIVIYAAAYRVFPGFIKLKLCFGNNSHIPAPDAKNDTLRSETHFEAAEIYKKEELPERDKKVAEEMSYFVNWVEKEILLHPPQWCWDYNKWSRIPK